MKHFSKHAFDVTYVPSKTQKKSKHRRSKKGHYKGLIKFKRSNMFEPTAIIFKRKSIRTRFFTNKSRKVARNALNKYFDGLKKSSKIKRYTIKNVGR